MPDKPTYQELEAKVKELEKEIIASKQTEKALGKITKKYREFLETIPHGVQEIDLEGRIVFCNTAYNKMLGYDIGDLIGTHIWETTATQESAEKLMGYFKQLIEKQPTAGEYYEQKKCRDGRLLYVRVNWNYIHNATGNLEGFIAVITDFTNEKKAQDDLEENILKYRTLFEMLSDAIFLIDKATGNILEVNPTASKMYGFTRDEFLQMKNTDVSAEPESTHRATHDNLRSIPLRYHRKKDKNIFPVEITASHLIWKGKEAHIASIRDISSRIEGEQEREELQNQLNQLQKMESIGNLAGGIAHDFNNLLFPIIGMSELLLEDLPGGSPEHEYVLEILKAGKRAGDLVKQILAFSRQSEHKKIPVQVQLVVKEVLKLSRSAIPSDVEISEDIQTDCGLVMADPTQIHQVAMNLITNAYHAMDKPDGKILVSLKETVLEADDLADSPLQPGKYAMLRVSDTGCGIEPAIMDKIFEPYFTTKERGKGTGLGLAVVYGIVSEYGGDIHVNSEVKKGTTFTVYIPLLAQPTKIDSLEKPEILQTGTERILLVDDEDSIAQLEKQTLERLGYRVTSHTNSLDALNAFWADPDAFDMVITDMTMPNMTGDQLTKALISIRPDLPVIICTGFNERINEKKAESIGIKGFLMKPVLRSQMARTVRKVLDEAKASDQQKLS